MIVRFERAYALAALILFGAPSSRPQGRATEAISPTFEAASVKPSGAEGKLTGVRIRGGRFTANSVNMLGLITDAYQIQHYQIVEGPKWFDSEGFDIEAVAGSVPTRGQFREMLQALLAGRFQLKFHKETREISINGLVLAKNGPKFHEIKGGGGAVPGQWGVGHLRTPDLATLAALLSTFLPAERPILDKTGLTGAYDLDVNVIEYWRLPENRADKSPNEGILGAALDQLGLKLVPMKAPVEMFVIDHVEKPSEN
jgi:uncharacterized protein (TIGR03435 family)